MLSSDQGENKEEAKKLIFSDNNMDGSFEFH
jgi:hypothetical protein